MSAEEAWTPRLEAEQRARYRYSCLDHFGEDPQHYGYAANFGMADDCREAIVQQLTEMQRRHADFIARDGRLEPEDHFFAQQNAQLVRDAETYYRTMFRSNVESWNVRDTHMADTIGAIARFMKDQHTPAKIVVWAHNSHLGDASVTQMGRSGEVNVGQLMRKWYRRATCLLGL